MKRKPKESLHYQRIQFATELTTIKVRAGQLGLFATMQKLDAAVKEVGYEIARTAPIRPEARDE